MEGLQKFVRSITKDAKSGSSSSSSLPESPYNLSGGSVGGLTDALSSTDQSRIIFSRAPRQVVSLWTCSKLCMFFFVAGVFVGYTIKRRVKSWASKLLKRLKDD
ncbi:hypothetical protein ACOSP7_008637 [Xanthoceras sorbifolium]|uniref:Transmembrane protein n=1 Tax=Xanthoceras sorbifolium TaxID=99658 RepID=A0ABQ8ICZ7_9ROSI|nr:hypothetical protein JRO89_XS03G0306200 [Xanthoceras sorbifolium]